MIKRAMSPMVRKFRRHYGVAAKHLTVRAKQPWYWQAGLALLLVGFGYVLAYWHLTEGKFGAFSDNLKKITEENTGLQARLIQMQRQMQVQEITQGNLSNELKSLQDESLKLKQDVLFYKNMVEAKKRVTSPPVVPPTDGNG